MINFRNLYSGTPNTKRGEPSHISIDPTGETDNVVFACGRVCVIRSLSDPLSANVFTMHTSSVTSARFSPDAKLVASADDSGVIRLWFPDSLNQKSTFDIFPGPVRDIAFSSDGKFLMACGECRGAFVKLGKVPTGSPAGAVKGHTKRVMAVDMKGGAVASASEDMSIGLVAGPPARDMVMPKFLRHHQAFVNDIRFSPDAKLIAAASSDRTVSIIDAATSQLVHTLSGHEGSVTSVAWIDDSRLLSSSNDKTIKEWAIPAGTCEKTYDAYGSDVMDMQVAVAYNKKASEIVSISLRPQINIVSPGSASVSRVLRGHSKQIIGLTAVDRRFYTADYSGLMIAWDFDVGPAEKAFNGKGPATSVCAIAANHDIIANVGLDGKVFVTSTKSLTYGKPVVVKGGGVDIGVAHSTSPNFSTIMINETRMVAVNSAADAVTAELKFSNSETGCAVAVSPDASLIAAGIETSGGAGELRFYTLSASTFTQAGDAIKLRAAPNKLAFSPDGDRIAVGEKSRHVKLFDCSTRDLVTGGGLAHTARVDAISFSHDGMFVASGGMDGSLAVWPVNSDKDPVKLVGAHRNGVTGIAFVTSDCVVSSGGDSCIRSWTL